MDATFSVQGTMAEQTEILEKAASWFYEVCSLYEDDDLDPDDHLEVIKRALTSSDCDDFAWMLHQVTGWQVVQAAWTVPNEGFGHHTMVRSPDGRLLDGSGWTDEETLRGNYIPRRSKAKLGLADIRPPEPLWLDMDLANADCSEPEFDANGNSNDDTSLVHMLNLIRNLPYAPFDTPEFKVMSLAPFTIRQDIAQAPAP